MMNATSRLMAFISLLFISITVAAQPVAIDIIKEVKPYKVLTSGKQITIKSSRNIKHIMLWTTGGNRVVEQKEINNSTYSFTIPVNQKAFYLMVGMVNGKIYTEKIGIQ